MLQRSIPGWLASSGMLVHHEPINTAQAERNEDGNDGDADANGEVGIDLEAQAAADFAP